MHTSFLSIITQIRRATDIEKKLALVAQFNSKELKNYFIAAYHPDLYFPDVKVETHHAESSIPLAMFFRDADYYFHGANQAAMDKAMRRNLANMSDLDAEIVYEAMNKEPTVGLTLQQVSKLYPDVFKYDPELDDEEGDEEEENLANDPRNVRRRELRARRRAKKAEMEKRKAERAARRNKPKEQQPAPSEPDVVIEANETNEATPSNEDQASNTNGE